MNLNYNPLFCIHLEARSTFAIRYDSFYHDWHQNLRINLLDVIQSFLVIRILEAKPSSDLHNKDKHSILDLEFFDELFYYQLKIKMIDYLESIMGELLGKSSQLNMVIFYD